MECSQQTEWLEDLNLNLDIETKSDIITYMHKIVGEVAHEKAELLTYAAAAIVGELKKMPSVGSESTVPAREDAKNGETVEARQLVGVGITIEKIMRRLQPPHSKEQFLDVLGKALSKDPTIPHALNFKVGRVALTYRMFKKYRQTFQKLEQIAGIPEQNRHTLLAIFWMLYLFVKLEERIEENEDEAMRVLLLLVRCAFQKLLTALPSPVLAHAISQNFSEQNIQYSELQRKYEREFEAKISQIYSIRYSKGNFQLKQRLDDYRFLERYLDDMMNLYDRDRSLLNQQTVDETSYLMRKRDFTPLTIFRPGDWAGGEELRAEVLKKINFMEEEEAMSESYKMNDQRNEEFSTEKQLSIKRIRPVDLSPLYNADNVECTPVTERLENLRWSKNCQQRVGKNEHMKIKGIFEQLLRQSYEEYENDSMDKILRAIRHFSPGCFNPDKRKKEIYTLFVYFCCRIADDYAANSEYKQIFSEVGSFDSVLCISTDLFNFSHNTLSADYYEYCGIFGVSVLSAFKLINWFGRNAELPKGMAVYLFNIEKKIVIHDIWEDGLGYQLITSNSQKYSNLAILKRLRLHSLERVREICHVAALDQRMASRISSLFLFILDQKKLLLRHNKIDQIIICCTVRCLEKEPKEKTTMDKIVRDYNSLRLSHNLNQFGLSDDNGNVWDLREYYRRVFLKELQEEEQQLGAQTDDSLKPLEALDDGALKLFSFSSFGKNESPRFGFRTGDVPAGKFNLSQGAENMIDYQLKLLTGMSNLGADSDSDEPKKLQQLNKSYSFG